MNVSITLPAAARRLRALPALLCLAMLCSPAAAAEVTLADLRADFPTEGEKFKPPTYKNEWIFYVANRGIFRPDSVMTWWHDPEKWPDGLLSLWGTTAAAHASRKQLDAVEILPGPNDGWLVARWNSTVDGDLKVRGYFQRVKSTPDHTDVTEGQEFMVRHNEGEPLVTIRSEAVKDTAVKEFEVSIPGVRKGDLIDFMVASLGLNYGGETLVSATITGDEDKITR